MVKGNSRQVIVVKSPDPRLFDQAIFLLKEDAVENGGVSPRELLEEAQRVADRYVTERVPQAKKTVFRRILWAAAGAAPVALAWLASVLLF